MTQYSEPPAKGDILIVDDTIANLKLLNDLLGPHHHKVRSVTSGEMALTAIEAASPDLILLDIRMPEMDGFEVCAQLKSAQKTRNILGCRNGYFLKTFLDLKNLNYFIKNNLL